MSISCWDIAQARCSPTCRRTKARASAHVGRVGGGHARLRTPVAPGGISSWAVTVMLDDRRHNPGVVRPIARAGHWRGVALPPGARAAAHVTARVQRRTPQVSRCAGVCSRFVDHTAGGVTAPWGARLSTQRRGTGGWPACSHTAVSVHPSPSGGPAPDPWSTVSVVHGVSSSVHPASRVARRCPVSRGRPCGLGSRRGGGASRAASRRSRVLHRARDQFLTWSSHSSAASRRSATTTPARPGQQRTTLGSLCQARAPTVRARRPRRA
jgi:hypothetical protein